MSAAVADVLDRAAELVERGWTQDVLARDVLHNRVEPNDPQAVEWCLSGAMSLADPQYRYRGKCAAQLRWLLKIRPEASLVEWQDSPYRRQGHVVAALRRAAALARGADG